MGCCDGACTCCCGEGDGCCIGILEACGLVACCEMLGCIACCSCCCPCCCQRKRTGEVGPPVGQAMHPPPGVAMYPQQMYPPPAQQMYPQQMYPQHAPPVMVAPPAAQVMGYQQRY